MNILRGIKDKNGRELCEGNIVKISFQGEIDGDYLVVWNMDDACYELLGIDKRRLAIKKEIISEQEIIC